MDVCCLSRPFDDQSQDKVRFETEAVITMLKRCDSSKDWCLVGSDIIILEISKNNDTAKKQKILFLYNGATEIIKYNNEIRLRAADFRKHNVKLLDSFHLAAAECASVDILLTTDLQFMKAAARTDVKIRVENPLYYYLEVLKDEQS